MTAGYVFSQVFWATKWRAARSEGQRLLFESAFWGTNLTIFSWSSFALLGFLCQNQKVVTLLDNVVSRFLFNHIFNHVPDLEGLPVFLGSLAWGIVLPRILNLFTDDSSASRSVIEKFGNELEKLLYDALQTGHMVSLTLNGGMVYVGWPAETPHPEKLEDLYIRILPAFSGHRDPGTKELKLTTKYFKVYEKLSEQTIEGLEIKSFEKVIRRDEILTANFYSPKLEQSLFSNDG